MPQEFTKAPHSALVLMAHPDDLEFMVGGTIARWVNAGCAVHLLLATRGEGGNQRHPEWDGERVIEERRGEQDMAALLLGLQNVTWLTETDGETLATLDLRRRLVQEIRQVKPDVVILADPTCYYHGPMINHPDHRAVGEAALAAVYPLAGNPMYAPELGAPHRPSEVWLTLAQQPDTWVDIGDFMQKKLGAIRCHVSQVAHNEGLEAMIRKWNEHREGDSLSYREHFRRMVQG